MDLTSPLTPPDSRRAYRDGASPTPSDRLYALPGTMPPKPGLQHVAAIAVEMWDLPLAEIGSFLAFVPAPFGQGSVTLADGRNVHGFVCEVHALAGARDITAFGGWCAFLGSQ